MTGFNFESGGRRCIKPILEKYQSGEVIKNTKFYQNQFYDTSFYLAKILVTILKAECEGYSVKTKEQNFPISNYPLEQTEFFYEQKQGMASST